MNKRLALLILGELFFAIAALFVASLLRFGSMSAWMNKFELIPLTSVFFLLAIVLSSYLTDIHNVDKLPPKRELFLRVTMTSAISFLILSALYYMAPGISLGRGFLVIAIAVFALCQFLWHIAFHACLHLPGVAERVLIIGTGTLAGRIGGIIADNGQKHLLGGYINCAGESVHVPQHHVLHYGNGNGNGFLTMAKKDKVDKIVVSLSERRGVFPVRDILDCKLGGIEVLDAPSFFEQVTGKLLIENMTPSSLIFSDGFRITPLTRRIKRVFDIAFVVIGLILVLPIIPLIALLVRLDSPGPIFFRQTRVGEGEKNFTLFKFRTMREDAEEASGAVWAEKNDPRVTRCGKFLRKSRLDELPQLFNVLKGEMSFIGPRPERPEFVGKLKEVIPYYAERHIVKPGVTGWAQIKYPYGSSVEDAVEKLRYDLYYIKNLSLMHELTIVLETIKVVLFGRGGR